MFLKIMMVMVIFLEISFHELYDVLNQLPGVVLKDVFHVHRAGR